MDILKQDYIQALQIAKGLVEGKLMFQEDITREDLMDILTDLQALIEDEQERTGALQ